MEKIKKYGLDFMKQQGVVVAFLVLVLIASIRYSEFMTYGNVTNVLRQSSMIGLISIGMTFVILTGGIDLSVGAMVAFAGVLVAKMSGSGLFVMIFFPILICTALGAANGLIVTKMKIAPFIATLGMMMAVRGVNLVLTGGVSVRVSDDVIGSYQVIARKFFLGIPIPVWIVIIVLLTAMYVSKYTKYGRHIYAVGGNEEASVMMGLNVDWVKIRAYMFSGLLAGIAGVIFASRVGAGQPVGCEGWEMTAIAATAIGGTQLTGGKGKVFGTIIGVLIIGIITNILNLQGNVNSWWQGIITGLLLLVVVVIQSQTIREKIMDRRVRRSVG